MIAQTAALGPGYDALPDDTEETLVGSSLHQGAITAIYTGLILCGPQRGLPWFVGNQIELVIPREGNTRPYKPSPDILVHPTLTNASRTSLILATDGPPALIIEVASPSTALRNDINLIDSTGKPSVYADIGVREYLVFDPTGDILGVQVWARRSGANGFIPWTSDANGRWTSSTLGVSFEPQGVLLRVYNQDGALIPTVTEYATLLAERDRRLETVEEELRKLRGS